jgi:hypothetical protein
VVQGQPAVDPSAITVRGPKRMVEVMQHARLAAFDVTGLTEGLYRRPIAIEAPPQRVTYLGITSITVTVRVVRRTHEAKFERLPVEVVGVTNGSTNPKHVMGHRGRSARGGARAPGRAGRAARGRGGAPPEQRSAKHGSVVARVTVDVASVEAQVQPPTVTVKW